LFCVYQSPDLYRMLVVNTENGDFYDVLSVLRFSGVRQIWPVNKIERELYFQAVKDPKKNISSKLDELTARIEALMQISRQSTEFKARVKQRHSRV